MHDFDTYPVAGQAMPGDLSAWVQAAVLTVPEGFASTQELYASYRAWMHANVPGQPVYSQHQMAIRLGAYGLRNGVTGGRRGWLGVAIRPGMQGRPVAAPGRRPDEDQVALVRQWIAACCIVSDEQATTSRDLWESFFSWSGDEYRPVTQIRTRGRVKFAEALKVACPSVECRRWIQRDENGYIQHTLYHGIGLTAAARAERDHVEHQRAVAVVAAIPRAAAPAPVAVRPEEEWDI